MSNKEFPRIYEAMLRQHVIENRQMAFVAGARQVGKTTCCRNATTPGAYMNWDNEKDRRLFLRGPAVVAEHVGAARAQAKKAHVVLDELHKYARWKTFLKGFFDSYGEDVGVVVTGSSRLDTYRRGGDSLMGRYFLYRMHPLSVAELLHASLTDHMIRQPVALSKKRFDALWRHGGFPEPLQRSDDRFTRRWQRLRRQQLLREDIRDLTRVQELGQLEVLATLLSERSGAQLIYSNLAGEVKVSVDTIRRWVTTLSSLYFGFLVRPWFRNVAKALRKEPKWFLSDWSVIDDEGARAETFVACHLQKAVDGWQDLGLGEFELRYVRDKMKREVDFLVVRDRKPWFLVEVKKTDTKLSPALSYFQEQLRVPHAFQVVIDLDFEDVDCFRYKKPTVIPARTFLSQLL